MHFSALVADVQKVLLTLRVEHGEFKLAMLFNVDSSSKTGWNVIISSDWTDQMGVAQATHMIALLMHDGLSLENKSALGRVTVLKTDDPFVDEMRNMFAEIDDMRGFPLRTVNADGVQGGAFIFYLRSNFKTEVASTE
jgi:hypothetical protein